MADTSSRSHSPAQMAPPKEAMSQLSIPSPYQALTFPFQMAPPKETMAQMKAFELLRMEPDPPPPKKERKGSIASSMGSMGGGEEEEGEEEGKAAGGSLSKWKRVSAARRMSLV